MANELWALNLGDGIQRPLRDNSAVQWDAAASSVKKNLLKNTASTQTINGVTFTVNSDLTITVTGKNTGNGTAWFGLVSGNPAIDNGDYILNGCPIGGSNTTYKLSATIGATTVQDTGSGAAITASGGSIGSCSIGIGAGYEITGTLVFKPMIRLASITNADYAPWIPDNAELDEGKLNASANAFLGAHNLFNNTAIGKTENNVTFTVNADKTVTVDTGGNTSTANTSISCDQTFPAGTYRLSGCPSQSGLALQVYLAQSPWTNYGYDYGDGVEFTLTSETKLRIQMTCLSGKTVSNKVFEPMITLAADTYTTYQPYAMTNRELTTGKVGLFGGLESPIDLNNIKDTGIYSVLGNTPANCPEANGTLIVNNRDGHNCNQMLIRPTKIFIRAYGGGSWTGWFVINGTSV